MNALSVLLTLTEPYGFKGYLGCVAEAGLMLSGLCFGFPGPLFLYVVRRVAR